MERWEEIQRGKWQRDQKELTFKEGAGQQQDVAQL